MLVFFIRAASRLVAIKSPSTRTSSSCFEPRRQIMYSGHKQNKVTNITFEKNIIFGISLKV